MSTNKPGVILQAYDPSYEAGIGKRSKYEASAVKPYLKNN
jgi:hypothetical protein